MAAATSGGIWRANPAQPVALCSMMEWWCSGGANPTQATWMSRHASGYLRPASIRWCLGRGTSVIIARPCKLWTDQAPAVLVDPAALRVTYPLGGTCRNQGFH